LSILVEITRPSRTLRWVVRASSSLPVVSSAMCLLLRFQLLGRGDLALAQQRLDPGHLAPHLRDARDVVELAGGVLEAEVEQLLLRFTQPVLEFGVVELSELCGTARHLSAPQPSS